MPETQLETTLDAPAETGAEPPADVQLEDLVELDLLVEDISIDGMCGVY